MNGTVLSGGMNAGDAIYGKSISIIDSLLKDDKHFNSYSEAEKAVVKRVIHATSDISYSGSIFFTNGSAEKSVRLIKEKILKKEPLKIVCDSEMTKAGISRNVNKNIILDLSCYINSAEMPSEARGTTKSAFSIKIAIREKLPDVIIIGNAPTALASAIDTCEELYRTINYKPSLIIGMPVGFVGASESKEALYKNNFFNAIGNFGNLGGSSSAAAAMNALLGESL